MGILRSGLRLLLVLILAAASCPAAATSKSSSRRKEYLPAAAGADAVVTEPGGGVWQGSQLLVAALEGFNELASRPPSGDCRADGGAAGAGRVHHAQRQIVEGIALSGSKT